MLFEVPGKQIDALGQECDLHFWRASVSLMDLEACDDFVFGWFFEGHASPFLGGKEMVSPFEPAVNSYENWVLSLSLVF